MLDVLTLLTAIAGALSKPGPLDWASVGPAIGVHLTGVRPIGTRETASAIEGGELVYQGLPVDGVISQTPRREISLFFPEGTVRDPDIATRRLGADQRIVPPRSGSGYASAFAIGDAECAVLVNDQKDFVVGVTAREAMRPQ